MADNFFVKYIANSFAVSGVTSVNSITGAATIVAGSGITVTPSGQNITIATSGGSGANTTLSNLGTTAINSNLIMNQSPLNDITTTAADGYFLRLQPGRATTAANNLILNGGSTDAGTAGQINMNGGTSDSGKGGDISLTPGEGTTTDGNILLFAGNGGFISLAGDVSSVVGQPWCATGVSGEGYWNTVATFAITDLVSSSWSANLPAIVLNGTTAEASTGGGVGIIFDNSTQFGDFPIITCDRSDTHATAGIFMYTGKQTGTGANGAASGEIDILTGTVAGDGNSSGPMFIGTGGATGAGADTGGIYINTGNCDGNAGGINVSLGSSSGGGTHGNFLVSGSGVIDFVNMSTLNLPVHSADPTIGVTAGSMYFKTGGLNKIRIYNGVSWETVTSV